MSTPTAALASPSNTHAGKQSPLRMLAWKEWRENSLIFVSSPILAAVFFFCFIGIAHANHAGPMPVYVCWMIAAFLWVISALLCGSNMVAPEVGSGSLQLLGTLPITRGRIWWTKFGVNFSLMIGCLIASSVAMAVLSVIGLAIGLISHSAPGDSQFYETIAAIAFASFPLFATGSLVSNLTDRSITAFVVSAVVAVAVYSLVGMAIIWGFTIFGSPTNSNAYNTDITCSVWIAFTIVSACFLRVSYRLFVDGETLKTRKRYQILSSYILPIVTITVALLIALGIIIS